MHSDELVLFSCFCVILKDPFINVIKKIHHLLRLPQQEQHFFTKRLNGSSTDLTGK